MHILGRLSLSFPQKAAKRALWAFCTPPRLPAPEPLTGPGLTANIVKSAQDLTLLHWSSDQQPQNQLKKALLVHGWGLQGLSMQSFVPGLLDAGFAIYSLDGPAHGDSPGVRATGADFVRAILALGEEFGPFDLIVGHSVGGAAASIAMAKGAAIKRGVLLAPAYLPDILDIFAAQVELTPEVKSMFYELLTAEAKSDLEEWASPNLAQSVKQPVVIFHDPQDAQVSVVHSRRYAEVAPDAKLVEIDGAGHNRILHNPQVLEAIAAFAMA
jgi:pimeloyl-ACP methyl ester carboxylesterase